jgi:hypothetical protein
MIQNFTLWNVCETADAAQFFATSAGFHRINKGTREMVVEMLTDVGWQGGHLGAWTVGAFATDYLSDDRDSADWVDRWNASFAINVQLSGNPKFSRTDSYLIATMASDKTWRDDLPVPELCLVVADFRNEADRRKFAAAAQLLDGELNVRRSCAHDRQAFVYIPASEAFFEKGAGIALEVEELALSVGGTTHWRDRRF